MTNASTGVVTYGFPVVRADINPGVIGVTASFLRKLSLYDMVNGQLTYISESVSKWNEVDTGSVGGQVGEDLTVEQAGAFGAISFSGIGNFGVLPQNNP